MAKGKAKRTKLKRSKTGKVTGGLKLGKLINPVTIVKKTIKAAPDVFRETGRGAVKGQRKGIRDEGGRRRRR